MIEYWSVEKEVLKIDLLPIELNCKKITLPIIINPNENSELFLIQLRHLYVSYLDFVENLLGATGRIPNLTYNQIESLNAIAIIFYDYIESFNLKKYNLKNSKNYDNMEPTQKTPFCEYLYDEIRIKTNEIDDFFDDVDICKLPSNNEYDF